MAAIDSSLVARSTASSLLHTLLLARSTPPKKNNNWAGRNAGVVLVFAIVFVIVMGLILLFVYRKLLARRAARATA
ncbi:MAG: hypothetical protein M1826_003535 [Phylliscum demangeonii]|nr:MAG: hypothetical protein M1826_003535 [Phylliscum demangeonii]